MSRPRTVRVAILLTLVLFGAPALARCDTAPDSASANPIAAPASHDGLEHLVPELEGNTYRLEPGVRPYVHRVSFSPGYGELGSQKLFAFRVAYNPNPWLGYEGSIGHTPGHSTHAVLHMVNAIVRHPFPGRLQPYLTAGYGMMLVYPGQALNVKPVTKNAVAMGGGLEFYIRGDLAVRAEVKRATVFGRQPGHDGTVTYDYLHETIGLAFYRSLKP
jgi:opacity protein-like surface antigen